MTLTLGAPSAGFSGFTTTAFDARLARGDDSIELSLLVYEDREAVKEDWQLTFGQSPAVTEGRIVPSHVSTWWNENIVVVVRASVGDIASDALDAFLALGEAAGAVRQLAYVGTDGAIWLVNADGSGQTRLADVCSRQDSYPFLAWSAGGDKLAVSCKRPGDSQHSLVVLDEAGRSLAEAEGMTLLRWSPDGRYIPYRQGGAVKLLDTVQGTDLTLPESADVSVWSPDGSSYAYVGNSGEAVIYDVASGQQTSLAVGIDRVMAWVLGGKALLVASNVRNCGITCLEDVSLLDLDSGELTSVPQLDDSTQFWLSPDATKAVVIARSLAGMLAIYDLRTGEETPVPDSIIGFPSEGIPRRQVAFSPDGRRFYWADASREPATIYRANMDGTGLTEIGTVPSLFVWVSGDGKAAYVRPGVPAPIGIADFERGTRVEVGDGFATMAWRPIP